MGRFRVMARAANNVAFQKQGMSIPDRAYIGQSRLPRQLFPSNHMKPDLAPTSHISPVHKTVSHTWLHTHTNTCPQICPNHEFSFPTYEG